MLYDTADQEFHVILFDEDGRVSGQAANLSCTLAIDGGAAAPLDDATPTEIGSTGEYVYDLLKAETKGHQLSFVPQCSVSGVQAYGLPSNIIYTTTSIASGGASVSVPIGNGVALKRYDFPTHYRGDTWPGVDSLIVTNADESPADLTGASIRMFIKRRKGLISPYKRLMTDDGTIEITDAGGGVFRIPPVADLGLPAHSWWYDIEITFASLTKQTVQEGLLPVELDTSK